jgi:hypothetical protein
MAAMVLAAATAAAGAAMVTLRHGTPGVRELAFTGIRPSSYATVEDGGAGVLVATAERSASLIYARVELDASTRPLLRWRWRVDALPTGGDLRQRGTDDAGARVYVGFRCSSGMVPVG